MAKKYELIDVLLEQNAELETQIQACEEQNSELLEALSVINKALNDIVSKYPILRELQ